MDRYSIPVYSSINYAKHKLDTFCELLFNYHFLSKALFTSSLDREACYNAFKGFVDIVRFNDTACSESLDLKSRHETVTSASGRDNSPLKSLLLDFLHWRDANFSLSDPDACSGRIRSAYSMAFDILNVLSESINSEVSKLDGTQRFYEVISMDNAAKENILHPVYIEPKWNNVAEDILQKCSSNVTGVWSGYFDFMIITDNAIGDHLHEVADAAAATLRKYDLTSPDHYSFPVIITEAMLKALLCSCYMANPFLYYEFLSDTCHVRGHCISGKLTAPLHQLLFAMAIEALISETKICIGQNTSQNKDSMLLYRHILKILRLKILFFLKSIILYHVQVFDYYRDVFSVEASWIISLKRDSEQSQDAWSSKRRDIFIRYYPKIRALIDSMGWVFDSTLSH